MIHQLPRKIKLHFNSEIKSTLWMIKFELKCTVPCSEAAIFESFGRTFIYGPTDYKFLRISLLPIIWWEHPESKIQKLFPLPDNLLDVVWFSSKLNNEFHYSPESPRIPELPLLLVWAAREAPLSIAIAAFAHLEDAPDPQPVLGPLFLPATTPVRL